MIIGSIKNNVVFAALAGLLMLIFTAFLFKAGMDVPYSSQQKYFDSIRSIAAIIFGVSGAWLAITYPKALMSAEKARSADASSRKDSIQDAQDDAEVLLGFINTMIVSILIIAISLSVPFVKEALSQFSWAVENRGWFRGSLYALIWILAVSQLSLLYVTLRSTSRALGELRRHMADAEVKSDRDDNEKL